MRGTARAALAGLVVVVASIVIVTPATPASAHAFPCLSTYFRWEHNPINYVYGGSVTGNIATGVGNATAAWSSSSNVDFNWGLYDVAIDASDFIDSNLTGYNHDQNSNGNCLLTSATVSFNSGDFNYLSQGEWNTVTSHEMGHTLVLDHEPNSTYCSPRSIMLAARQYMWNLMFQWQYLSFHDAGTVNLLYP